MSKIEKSNFCFLGSFRGQQFIKSKRLENYKRYKCTFLLIAFFGNTSIIQAFCCKMAKLTENRD